MPKSRPPHAPLRFPELPTLDIILIDRPDGRALRVGEASAAPVVVTFGNAIFDATGVRQRMAPFAPTRAKAAFVSAAI
jgi:nicotinate dehydrogenase subunit B